MRANAGDSGTVGCSTFFSGSPCQQSDIPDEEGVGGTAARVPVTPLTTTPSRTFLGRGLALKLWAVSWFSCVFLVACLSWSLLSISSSKPSGTVGSFTGGFFSSSAPSRIFLFSSRALIRNLPVGDVSVRVVQTRSNGASAAGVDAHFFCFSISSASSSALLFTEVALPLCRVIR